MDTIKNSINNGKRIMIVLLAMTICFSMAPGFKTEAKANNGAAFLGGMVAAHVIGGAVRRDKVRTAAAVQEANQTAPAYSAQPSAKPSAKQSLDQLDKLAAGGYITQEEYKTKKKAILDGI
jgi:hypothetical protein